MLAGFAFHDSGHNNADCGVDRCNVNFLPSQRILSLASGHMLFCPKYFLSSQASDNFLLLYSKKKGLEGGHLTQVNGLQAKISIWVLGDGLSKPLNQIKVVGLQFFPRSRMRASGLRFANNCTFY